MTPVHTQSPPTDAHRPDTHRLSRTLVFATALIWVLSVMVINLLTIVWAAQNRPGLSDHDAYFARHIEAGQIFDTVGGLTQDSPFARAGVKNGDHIRFDRLSDDHRALQAGDVEGLTVLGAQPRHIAVTLTPASSPDRAQWSWFFALDGISALLGSAIGLLILLRSRGAASLIVLGVLFATLNYSYELPMQNAAPTFPLWQILYALNGSPVCFPLFALLFYREHVGRVPRFVYGLFGLLGAATYGIRAAVYVWTIYGMTGLGGHEDTFDQIGGIASMLISAGGLVFGWLNSARDIRRRYTFVLVALSGFIVYGASTMSAGLLGMKLHTSWLVWPFEIGGTAAPLIFAYAVLKDKVLDLGFVVNRALVYGIVSTVLLVAFGLIEWASEHFIPIEGKEKNVLIDAAIALTVFLTFHRLRDFVEELVEGVFFRQWHHNEAELRRFVRQASFVTKPQALRDGFLAELSRFTGGAEVALFQAEGANFSDGNFSDRRHIDADDPAVIAMKADHAAVESADHLDLPMIHRGELTGFVRLHAKPSGDSYRPDEREVLAWAAHQIGLDLHALRVEALESETRSQQGEIRELAARNADLLTALGARNPA